MIIPNAQQSTLRVLVDIWWNLSRRRRLQFCLLLLIMLLSEGSNITCCCLPTLESVSRATQQQPFTQHFASLIGITESNQLVLPVDFFALSAVLSALVRYSIFG